jgi:hypothetical protein
MALQEQPTPTASPASSSCWVPPLRGLITEADLPVAEQEWPGLRAFFAALPATDRPATFLDLVWRFETHRASTHRPS